VNCRWIQLAQDYVQLWVLVLEALNLQALLPECLFMWNATEQEEYQKNRLAMNEDK